MTVLILCTGNSCRSQMAHGVNLKSALPHWRVSEKAHDNDFADCKMSDTHVTFMNFANALEKIPGITARYEERTAKLKADLNLLIP